MENVREHMVFSGRVQMVGFRYKCNHIASDLGLVGWVRNNDDGTVEGEFQGPKESIDRLLARLKEDRFIRIDTLRRREISLRDDEKRFRVIG
jgi:acylphosphatase